MYAILKGAIGLAAASFVSLGAGAASAQSTATLTLKNNTAVALTYQTHSCIGSLDAPWPASIGATPATRNAYSTLTSNGCSVTYQRSDNGRSCRFVATRLRSSLTGPWNYPTVNATASSTGITCTYTITSVSTNGDWAVTLNVN
ncbi:hypothetical protein [Azospirillum soli]|uniref:hypothetical protein n=1 Tax=Azospirillum soli TaxID=1304799 RepID=UPI001B3BF604|nr:hypothetical protein [Azospirillum soli]MBP2316905.1 hypothetical protein [Azospirillum soli]